MFVSGVDGCRAGWVAFKVEVSSLVTSVDVVDLAEMLSSRPDDLLCVAIDTPIGLLDSSRACDKAARKLLGQPRGTSVFAAPCRAAHGRFNGYWGITLLMLICAFRQSVAPAIKLSS